MQMLRNKETKLFMSMLMLAGFNVMSRVYMVDLPNIKPVTTVIILSALYGGLAFSWGVSLMTVVLSAPVLGFGTYSITQTIAWCVIATIAWLMSKVVDRDKVLPYLCVSGVMGYVFGVFVSLDVLFMAGWKAYVAYWIAGLEFDTLHAVGNLAFYAVLAPLAVMVNKYSREGHGYVNTVRKGRVQPVSRAYLGSR